MKMKKYIPKEKRSEAAGIIRKFRRKYGNGAACWMAVAILGWRMFLPTAWQQLNAHALEEVLAYE
jgi:hypothetical protein